MKAYIAVTATIFGLIAAAHVLRMISEGGHLLKDPFYILLTILAAGFCIWGWRLFMTAPRKPDPT